ncbi:MULTISPECIES: isoamylase early set domain-containing protein [Alkalimonas]|uniref:Isoamylase early set domain-containing protein n=1 Tax=Alkalimonas mucilaginosa TaxID=3057676 RepID=A0ABU7JIJ2_9GAMM|nr:isoamylase early set domain-containing protein [Alkalimonas sp. MEB004]MEE2025494.1 isoamylase early set domain-containing protein [Alkalimonas sp. MEB004]
MPLKKQFLKSRPVVKVTFEIPAEAAKEATSAYLLCEAQGWQKEPLKRLKNGGFKAVLELPTDQQDDFEFRYCLLDDAGNEQYDNDWQADGYRPTPLGVENSVVSVRMS